MFDNFKHIIQQVKKFYLLGVIIHDGKSEFHLLTTQFKDDELSILDRKSFSKLDESTVKYLKKDYPLILHLDGDIIISKETQNVTGYRNNLIFKSNTDDFYFYEFHQENEIYASLTRKDTILNFLDIINGYDKYVDYISFGPFVLPNLKSILEQQNTIKSSFYEVSFESNDIINFEKKETNYYSYNIGNETINEKETVLIASLIEYLFPNPKIKFDSDYLLENKEQSKYKKLFKFYGAAVLIFMVLALFSSHFILQNSIKDLAEKESLASLSSQKLVQLDELKAERILKEKVLLSSGVIDKYYVTKYFSDIGNTVPNSISLDFIIVKKPSKKIKPNEKPLFNLNEIEIGGYTSDDSSFNDWVKTLRDISWIKKIEIIEYNEDAKSKNSFLLNIKI